MSGQMPAVLPQLLCPPHLNTTAVSFAYGVQSMGCGALTVQSLSCRISGTWPSQPFRSHSPSSVQSSSARPGQPSAAQRFTAQHTATNASQRSITMRSTTHHTP